MSILITTYSILFFWLSWKKTDWSVYLILAFLPSYLIRFSVLTVPLTLLELMILILFLAWAIKNKFKNINWSEKELLWPLGAILVFATVSVFVSPDWRGALGVWKAYFIEPALFFLVFINQIKTSKQLKNVLWMLAFSAFYLSIIAIWQKFTGWKVPAAFLTADGSVDRVVSVFGYPNALGLYLGPIIILLTGFIFQNKNWFGRLIKIFAVLLGFVTILLAKSEAAIGAVIIVWLIWLLTNKKTWRVGVSIVVIGVIVIFSQPNLTETITQKITLNDYSGFVRSLIWKESWVMLKDHWFWGAGLNGYQKTIAPYHLPTFEIFMYPHNIVLNFWSELGFLGLFSFVWLTAVFLWKNLKSYVKNKNNLISLVLTFAVLEIIIHGLVDAPYFKNDLAVLVWLIIGIYIVNKRVGSQ